MTEKERFYKSIKKFFDAGVFREIYSTDELAIFNVSNRSYIGFDYAISNKMETPHGFSLYKNYLEPIMMDNQAFYRWINDLNDDELNKLVVNCGDRALEMMKLYKQKTDLTGPVTDLDFEQALMEKYGQQKSR